MGWTVHVNHGDDVGSEEVEAEMSEKFSFLEEAEAWAEQQRALHPDAEVFVAEDLP